MSSKPNNPITNTFFTDIEEKIQLIIDEQNNKKPIIVAYGLMNAGKSYLLNMLTQHISEEFFRTNDIRETATIKKFESEKLFVEQRNDRIYTDRFVTITQKERIINGIGLESNQKLTKYTILEPQGIIPIEEAPDSVSTSENQ